jgi:hypothetical protein
MKLKLDDEPQKNSQGRQDIRESGRTKKKELPERQRRVNVEANRFNSASSNLPPLPSNETTLKHDPENS